jgi:hypothetical protein
LPGIRRRPNLLRLLDCPLRIPRHGRRVDADLAPHGVLLTIRSGDKRKRDAAGQPARRCQVCPLVSAHLAVGLLQLSDCGPLFVAESFGGLVVDGLGREFVAGGGLDRRRVALRRLIGPRGVTVRRGFERIAKAVGSDAQVNGLRQPGRKTGDGRNHGSTVIRLIGTAEGRPVKISCSCVRVLIERGRW